MRRRPLLIVGLIALTAVAGIVFFLVRGGHDDLRTYVVRRGHTDMTVHAQGRVESANEVEVRTRVVGTLARLLVVEGQHVRVDDIIAVLDDSQQKALLQRAEESLLTARERLRESETLTVHRQGRSERSVEEAKARVAQCEAQRGRCEAEIKDRSAELMLAQKDADRIKTLFAAGAVAARDLDSANARVTSAQARLASAEAEVQAAAAEVESARASLASAQVGPEPTDVRSARTQVGQAAADVRYQQSVLRDTVIRAPFAGTVTRKIAEQGQVLSEGEAVCLLAATDRIRVNAEVDETDIGKISIGDPARVTHEAFPGRVFVGEVGRIGALAGQHTVRSEDPTRISDFRVVDVKIEGEFPATLRVGMTVDVEVTHHRASALLVPPDAVSRVGSDTFVEVVAPSGVRQRRKVSLGHQGEEEVEVLSGLREGDVLVLQERR
jgi:ABC exporter DevB family membrane fusion protein